MKISFLASILILQVYSKCPSCYTNCEVKPEYSSFYKLSTQFPEYLEEVVVLPNHESERFMINMIKPTYNPEEYCSKCCSEQNEECVYTGEGPDCFSEYHLVFEHIAEELNNIAKQIQNNIKRFKEATDDKSLNKEKIRAEI